MALRVFGPRHPAVAAETNVLAVFLVEHGRNREAEACYRQSMEIWERTLGPYSPELASGLNNLAILLFMEERPGYVYVFIVLRWLSDLSCARCVCSSPKKPTIDEFFILFIVVRHRISCETNMC